MPLLKKERMPRCLVGLTATHPHSAEAASQAAQALGTPNPRSGPHTPHVAGFPQWVHGTRLLTGRDGSGAGKGLAGPLGRGSLRSGCLKMIRNRAASLRPRGPRILLQRQYLSSFFFFFLKCWQIKPADGPVGDTGERALGLFDF